MSRYPRSQGVEGPAQVSIWSNSRSLRVSPQTRSTRPLQPEKSHSPPARSHPAHPPPDAAKTHAIHRPAPLPLPAPVDVAVPMPAPRPRITSSNITRSSASNAATAPHPHPGNKQRRRPKHQRNSTHDPCRRRPSAASRLLAALQESQTPQHASSTITNAAPINCAHRSHERILLVLHQPAAVAPSKNTTVTTARPTRPSHGVRARSGTHASIMQSVSRCSTSHAH